MDRAVPESWTFIVFLKLHTKVDNSNFLCLPLRCVQALILAERFAFVHLYPQCIKLFYVASDT